MTHQPLSLSLTRTRWILSLLVLASLMYALLLVMEPFLSPILWALVVTLSTWPVYRKIELVFPGRPTVSAGVMTSVLAIVFVAAVAPVLISLTGEFERAANFLQAFIAAKDFPVPAFVERLPVIGPSLRAQLDHLVTNRSESLQVFSQHKEQLLGVATIAARGVLQSLATFLTVFFVAFFLFRDGKNLGHQIRSVALKLGGERFSRSLGAAQQTVKGAVYGVVLTAFAQGFLAGVGFVICGAPVPILLGFTTMLASLIPFATPFIYMPVAFSLMIGGKLWWGLFLALWGVLVVSTADNILRPLFISQATSMPILLSVFGVLGGLFAFGLIGIFIGPVVVAVLMVLWHELVEYAKNPSS